MAKSQAASESAVSTTTNTVTDSYNQAFSRIENLSDVGNVSIQSATEGHSTMAIVLIAGVLAAIWLLKKGK